MDCSSLQLVTLSSIENLHTSEVMPVPCVLRAAAISQSRSVRCIPDQRTERLLGRLQPIASGSRSDVTSVSPAGRSVWSGPLVDRLVGSRPRYAGPARIWSLGGVWITDRGTGERWNRKRTETGRPSSTWIVVYAVAWCPSWKRHKPNGNPT